ncbi:exosortase H-associated membrane protein [Parahaliea aestuarii]|uniref:Uncharacterized protein n=1 Tax=Parahaliea aestuarii TaxID=1852021 RepID=A0A5C8ZU53_9GAMM|nr:exosortase H-associated membrane protein [Parahaliea aestuarii]TXS91092.1 hypothetical protein FVW59_12860 [Parahaliea aestuarii]
MNTATPLRFMGWVILLMIPLFGLWYALGTLPAAPAFLLARYALEWGLPDIVAGVSLDQTRMLVLTHFGEVDGALVSAEQAGYQLAYPVDTRLVSYSLPFYAALIFAARVPQAIERFCRGMVVLWLLMAIGLVCIELKNLMLGLQDALFQRAALPLPPPPVIALLYQLNTLIIPTLAPVLMWLWMARDSALLQNLGRVPVAAAATGSSSPEL